MFRTRSIQTCLFVLIAVAAGGFWLYGCEESDEGTLLDPPGGSAQIQGEITFDGEGGTDRPVAKIYALLGYDGLCSTEYSTIHPTGTFNGWNESIWTETPGMTYLGGCSWADEIDFDQVTIQWKFVTDGAWDTPADYTSGGEAGLSGSLNHGSGENINADILEADTYHMLLFEGTTPPSYLIASGEDAPVTTSDRSSGQFVLQNLLPGTYEIVIVVEGYITGHVSNVQLGSTTEMTLPTIDVVSASGALMGQVLFEDDPLEPPTVDVRVYEAGGTTVVKSDTTDATGAYTIRGLTTGTYDLAFRASGYVDASITDIAYTNGEDTVVDTVTMVPGCTSEFTLIEVLGDFNRWEVAAGMTQIASCIWKDTLTVSVSTYPDSVLNMKFRTGGAWDSPLDYGTCAQGEVQGLEGDVCAVSGGESALAVKFPQTAEYVFTLNEGEDTYRIELLSEVRPGSISGTVTYEDDPVDPPTTTIKIYEDGSTQVYASATASEDGTFTAYVLESGIYDLGVEAPGYETVTVEDIEVVEGEDTALTESIELPVQEGCTPSSSIEIVGDFNGWPGPGQTDRATLIGECVWGDTLTVTITSDDTQVFKFRTDLTWDPSYGSCDDYGGESYIFEFDGNLVTGTTCERSGSGTGIQVRFPGTGQYRFQLDERTQTFEIEKLE